MPMELNDLQGRLEKALPGALVQVQDLVGDGDHLQAIVVSDQFNGKSLLQQHQIVYAALGDVLKEQLHALALKTYSPQQWENFKNRG